MRPQISIRGFVRPFVSTKAEPPEKLKNITYTYILTTDASICPLRLAGVIPIGTKQLASAVHAGSELALGAFMSKLGTPSQCNS